MAIKYFTIFAMILVVVAAVLIVPSESTPVANKLGNQANSLDAAAPADNNREGRQFFGGYPGFGGSSASASASASASSGGYGMGGIGYPMMYGKK